MANRTVRIVFKDNTYTTFKDKEAWISDITAALKLPYILNPKDNYDDALIMPTENIKYIQIIDTPDEVKKEHKDEKQDLRVKTQEAPNAKRVRSQDQQGEQRWNFI